MATPSSTKSAETKDEAFWESVKVQLLTGKSDFGLSITRNGIKWQPALCVPTTLRKSGALTLCLSFIGSAPRREGGEQDWFAFRQFETSLEEPTVDGVTVTGGALAPDVAKAVLHKQIDAMFEKARKQIYEEIDTTHPF